MKKIKYCKILKKVGVEISRNDPFYKYAVVEYCQKQYEKVFGCRRNTNIKPSSARALLALMLAGSYVKHPHVADKIRQTPFKPKEKKVKNKKVKKSDLSKNLYHEFVKTKEFLSSREWLQVRYAALTKTKAVCQCCGNGRREGVYINVDHIKPRKYFPELALDINNLQVLCSLCNTGKSNRDATDWRDKDAINKLP